MIICHLNLIIDQSRHCLMWAFHENQHKTSLCSILYRWHCVLATNWEQLCEQVFNLISLESSNSDFQVLLDNFKLIYECEMFLHNDQFFWHFSRFLMCQICDLTSCLHFVKWTVSWTLSVTRSQSSRMEMADWWLTCGCCCCHSWKGHDQAGSWYFSIDTSINTISISIDIDIDLIHWYLNWYYLLASL